MYSESGKGTVLCLFMSGYTSDVIVHRGMFDEGVQFIPKPFSMKDLAAEVETALENRMLSLPKGSEDER